MNNNNKPTVCLVSREYPSETGWGGIGSYTYDLAQGLAEKGHQVHVVALGLKEDREYKDGPVYVHRIAHRNIFHPKGPLLEFLVRLEYSWGVYKKLKEIINQYSIDIVEVPNFFAEGFVFSLFKKVPLVTRLHSSFWEVIKAYGWKNTFDRRLSCWLEDSATLRSDLVTSSTTICSRMMADRLALDPKKVSVIPLGIPLPPEKDVVEAKTRGGAQNLNVLFVGRLERRKGVHVLMQGIPRVLEKIPQVCFTIIGRDTFVNERYAAFNGSREESFKESLWRDFPEKFKDRVTFEGYVEKEKLREYFLRCDIFVAPSLYESFGLIYLEAMGYGKPVIGCKVGGVPEVIREGETGLLVPPADPDALADAIVRLLKDEKHRNEMGKRARAYAVENFTRELMVQRTLEAYGKIFWKNEKF